MCSEEKDIFLLAIPRKINQFELKNSENIA